MTLKKIAGLRRRIAELRGQGDVPSRILERLARKIGRVPQMGGKEPLYIATGRRPLAIPHHSRSIKKGTKESILTQLEGDLATQEEELWNETQRNNGGSGQEGR